MENINIFNNIITITSFILNIFFIVPLVTKLYDYFSNKIYVKRVLNLSKEPVQISHSTFELITNIDHLNTFITFESLRSVNNIINLLNLINHEYDLIGREISSKDEINIGGFMTNKKVNVYFARHFKNFKFIANIRYKSEHAGYQIDKSMVEYSTEKFGFEINNDIFLETNREINDYAFIIKLTNSDFKDDNDRCVHILFGGGNIGTIKATEYLLTHCKQIYKKYKNNHYFFAIEVNRIDESINYSKGIIDLTDVMFTDDSQ